MYKVVMKAKDIPDGRTVYKVTGTTPYVFKRNMKVYVEPCLDKPSFEVKGLFMVGNAHYGVNEVSPDKELLVKFGSKFDLIHFLEYECEKIEDK